MHLRLNTKYGDHQRKFNGLNWEYNLIKILDMAKLFFDIHLKVSLEIGAWDVCDRRLSTLRRDNKPGTSAALRQNVAAVLARPPRLPGGDFGGCLDGKSRGIRFNLWDRFTIEETAHWRQIIPCREPRWLYSLGVQSVLCFLVLWACWMLTFCRFLPSRQICSMRMSAMWISPAGAGTPLSSPAAAQHQAGLRLSAQ